MSKTTVYVAGPYTTGDVGANMNKHINLANALIDCGYYPIVPCLNHFLHLYKPRSYEVWLDQDFALLERANCMFRIKGHSPGADREEEYCKELGIPVYRSLDELMKHEPVKRESSLEFNLSGIKTRKFKNYGFVFGGDE